jgi:hypothetical protein
MGAGRERREDGSKRVAAAEKEAQISYRRCGPPTQAPDSPARPPTHTLSDKCNLASTHPLRVLFLYSSPHSLAGLRAEPRRGAPNNRQHVSASRRHCPGSVPRPRPGPTPSLPTAPLLPPSSSPPRRAAHTTMDKLFR